MTKCSTIAILIFAACTSAGGPERTKAPIPQPALSADRVFEIRTYTAPPGKLDALNARFRDHTTRLFARHGMTNIGYWIPTDSVRSRNTIIYILAHANREAARASWEAFIRDPEWRQVRAESEANGPIVERVESVFVTPTDYSPIR